MIATKIEYCDSTVNPTRGCDGCELWNPHTGGPCFAAAIHTRFHTAESKAYPRPFAEVETVPGRMAKAAAWSDLAGKPREGKPWLDGRPRIVFIGDLTDTLCRAVPFQYLRAEIVGQVESKAGRRHRWLWFTKRPHRMAEFAAWLRAGGHEWPANLVPATSATDAQTLSVRLAGLFQIPARVRVLSLEPLRGPVGLAAELGDNAVAGRLWVIAGGASGNQATPTPADWFRAVRDDCARFGLPFFFKQWGTYDADGRRVGKAEAGRTLDGRQHNAVPEL